MRDISHKIVYASVRPGRVAVLLDRNADDWHESSLRIIEFFSQLWGGNYNIIVPTDGSTIPEIFWTILEAYDPDYVYIFNKTVSHPQLNTPFPDDFEISPSLANQLITRLSPFHFQEHVVEGGIMADSTAGWPLTANTTILPHCEHSDRVILLSEDMPKHQRLLAASVLGSISPQYMNGLEGLGITKQEVDLPTFTLFEKITSGSLSFESVDGMASAPFGLSMSQLGFYLPVKYYRQKEPALVIVGDAIEDFCLYYCLSRIRNHVVWLSPSSVDVVKRAVNSSPNPVTLTQDQELGALSFSRGIQSFSFGQARDRKIHVLGATYSDNQLEAAIAALRLVSGGSLGRGDSNIIIGGAIEEFVKFPRRLYELDNVYRSTTEQFLGEESAGFFNTPKPKNFRKLVPYEHRWITDISIRGHQIPRHHQLGTFVIRHSHLLSNTVRAGAESLSYFCPSIAYAGGDVDTILLRPSIFAPTAYQIFEELIKTAGYNCKISDKGFFTQDSIGKFGGLETLARFLIANSTKALLDKYTAASTTDNPSKAKTQWIEDGIYLKSDQRRYLGFEAIKKTLATNDRVTSTLIDELVNQLSSISWFCV